MSQVTILGLGNVLYGDEGIGVHLVHHLKRAYRFGPEVALVDGGTLGWALTETMRHAGRLYILDAVAAEPGKVYRFAPGDVPRGVGFGKLSSHEWEILEILWSLELTGELPPTVLYTVGVEPRVIQAHTLEVGVSSAVARGARNLVEALVSELREQGHAAEKVAEAPLVFALDDILEG